MQLEDLSKDELIGMIAKQDEFLREERHINALLLTQVEQLRKEASDTVAIPLVEFKHSHSNSPELDGIRTLPTTPAEALKELADLFYVNVECSRAEYVVGMVESALQPVQQPASVCNHSHKTCGHDNVQCIDCGAFRADTDDDWGIAAGKWFKSRAEANFYKENGRLPSDAAPVAAPVAGRLETKEELHSRATKAAVAWLMTESNGRHDPRSMHDVVKSVFTEHIDKWRAARFPELADYVASSQKVSDAQILTYQTVDLSMHPRNPEYAAIKKDLSTLPPLPEPRKFQYMVSNGKREFLYYDEGQVLKFGLDCTGAKTDKG